MTNKTEISLQESYQGAIDEIKKRHPQQGAELIQKAFEYACTVHAGQERLSGEPYISHCVAVAKILEELELDYVSIAAGLLHDVLEDTGKTLEELRLDFPEAVSTLIAGVTKITGLSFHSATERYAENLRKLLLAMAKDIRVIIIKLADRLHNMRTLEFLSEEEQRLEFARETLEIYAPLANRLGIHRIKWELEDLAMKYLYPEFYREIKSLVEQKKVEREAFVKSACEFLRSYLEQSGLGAEISGRAKHVYSIYRKMKRQGLSLDGIHDLVALRVITDTEEECWAVLGRIHSLWSPIPGSFDDYISRPKPNLYRSLHTTVVGPEGHPIEIQIRTGEMHQIAETGVAAHWRYKEGIKKTSEVAEKLPWLRQLSEWIREMQDPGDFMSALKEEAFADTIFCFTPKGDVITLPKGSTPLDFAYQVHTEVGNQCRGAMVNNRLVSLRYELNNGDIVRILTAKDAHPGRDWLEIVRTPTARTKIRHYLRSQLYQRQVESGREALLKALRHQGINLSLEQVLWRLQPEFKRLNVKDGEHFLAEIGFGTLSLQTVMNLLPLQKEKPIMTKVLRPKGAKRYLGITLDGISNNADISLRLARCCAPIPGEEILGFVTISRGIAVHRLDCPYLQRVIAETKPDKSRLLKASWMEGVSEAHRVSLRVIAWDRVGLLNEISGVISGMNINILATESKSYTGKKQAVLYFLLVIEEPEQLNRLFANLKNVKGIISFSRISRSW